MSVTQVLMGGGSWTVSFSDRLPQTIRDQIQPLDHIFIGPRNLLDLRMSDANTIAAVKAAGGYAGVILEIPDSLTLSGCDLSWWMGDADGRGPLKDTAIVAALAATTTNWLDQIFPVNGLTRGSTTNGTSFAGVSSPMSTRLEILNWICEQSDVEWIIRPDGAVDVGPSTTLFPAPSTTSARVITREPASSEGTLEGVEAVQIDRSRDATAVVSRVVVVHSADLEEAKFATATATPSGVRWKDFAGSTPTDRSLRAAGPAIKATAAAAVASRMVARVSVDQKEALLTSRTYNVTSEVRPGDRVWVYDPGSALYDTANQLTFRGQVIAPIQMRVHSLTWPIDDNLGVYARLDGGATWIDLTPYVAFEEAEVAWEVTISGRKKNRAPVGTGTVSVPIGKAGSNAQALQAQTGITTTSAKVGGWTPSWTNVNVGTGGSANNIAYYEVADGKMTIEAEWTLGTTGASVSGVPTLDMPTGWKLRYSSATARNYHYGIVRMVLGGTTYLGYLARASDTTLRVEAMTADTTNVQSRTISATAPATWAAGDRMIIMVSGIKVEPN